MSWKLFRRKYRCHGSKGGATGAGLFARRAVSALAVSNVNSELSRNALVLAIALENVN